MNDKPVQKISTEAEFPSCLLRMCDTELSAQLCAERTGGEIYYLTTNKTYYVTLALVEMVE